MGSPVNAIVESIEKEELPGSMDAFREFCRILTAQTNLAKPTRVDHRPWLTVLPIGNLACGLHSKYEDIECVALGNIRKEIFIEIAWERIKEAVVIDESLKPYSISTEQMSIAINGTTLNMYYFESKNLVNEYFSSFQFNLPGDLLRYPDILDAPLKFQLRLPDKVNAVVNELRDLRRFNEGSKEIPQFRMLYDFVKSWAKAAGLCGFGMLQPNALRELVWIIAMKTHRTPRILTLELNSFLVPFLQEHSSCCDLTHMSSSEYCALGSHLSITDTCSRTVHDEFTRLYQYLMAQNSYVALQRINSTPVAGWLNDEKFIRISVCYSGNSEIDGYRILTFMDNMFIKLIQSLTSAQDYLENVHFRVWPTRLVETSTSSIPGQIEAYEGFWIIGISGILEDGKKAAIEKLLAKWEEKIRISSQYTTSSVTIFSTLIHRTNFALSNLELDTRKWQRPLVEPDPALRLDLETRLKAFRAPIDMVSDQYVLHSSKPSTAKKLRPAMEVLNRLRWDRAFNVDDFVVIYKDRHGGMLEKPVKEWRADTTAADWIPQDRIWFFKRVSDRVVVWDRVCKTDLLNQG